MSLLQRADPRVSIIVPTFNRSPFLAECLESLFAQTLPPAQVIVVNDRSTDATRAVVEPFLSRILYLETAAQVGKPGAANLGLTHVTGEYVWVFDDDDVALPDALARFTAALERHPHCGFSWSPWCYADTRPDGRLGPVGWETTEPPIDEFGFVPALLQRNFLGGAALFARRKCYEEAGNYHPGLTRSQDYDIAIRFARRYPAVRVEGGATFIYRQHEGARGNTTDRFAAPARFAKWLQYDQHIFRELQKEMPLAEYLPPGHDLATSSRLALIQRFTLMASHLLVDEALEDLGLLARLADQGALTRAERRPLRLIAYADPWYGCGSVWDRPEFTARLRELATTSPLVRAIRAEAILGFLRGVRSQGPGRLSLVARRTLRLLATTSLTPPAPGRAG